MELKAANNSPTAPPTRAALSKQTRRPKITFSGPFTGAVRPPCSPPICHNRQKRCGFSSALNRSFPKRSPNVVMAVMSSSSAAAVGGWVGVYLTLGRVGVCGGGAPERSSRPGRLSRKMLMKLHHEKCSVQFISSRSPRDVEKKKKKKESKVRSVQIPVAPSVDLVVGDLKSRQTWRTFSKKCLSLSTFLTLQGDDGEKHDEHLSTVSYRRFRMHEHQDWFGPLLGSNLNTHCTDQHACSGSLQDLNANPHGAPLCMKFAISL